MVLVTSEYLGLSVHLCMTSGFWGACIASGGLGTGVTSEVLDTGEASEAPGTWGSWYWSGLW